MALVPFEDLMVLCVSALRAVEDCSSRLEDNPLLNAG
jgi:hypothetical protein